MRPVPETLRRTVRLLVLIPLLSLVACAGPDTESATLARIIWAEPASLRAETVTPEGLGVVPPLRLVMTLTGAPGQSARQQRFSLAPVPGDPERGQFRLAPADYRRFAAFQQKVVASFGANANFVVDLEVPYCAHRDRAAGPGAPVAKLFDISNGQLIMSRPADKTARDLQPALPDCE